MATAMQSKALVKPHVETRLPMPVGFDSEFWQILCEVIFPHVNNPRSIALAVTYCRARKLDILKRPVNVVPMWNSKLGVEVDTIWPSINETQITAARTHEWAGMDKPEFGEKTTETFRGRRKDKGGGWSEAQVQVTFYDWCSVTVYRVVGGTARAFVGDPVYWKEAYGRSGGTDLPNAIWQKRPIGQLVKCAKAAALRVAFPEEDSGHTAEEMAGGIIDEAALPDIEQPPRPPIAEVPQSQPDAQATPYALAKDADENWTQFGNRLIAAVCTASDHDVMDDWGRLNKPTLDVMKEEAPKIHSTVTHTINKHRLTLPQADADA